MTKEKIALVSVGGLFIFLIIIMLVNYWVNNSNDASIDEETDEASNEVVDGRQTGDDPTNASYYIGGEEIKLTDGKSEKKIPDSSSTIKTEILDKPVIGDMDGDGVEDAGVILIETGGGSGTFYYSAVAIKNPDNSTYTGSNAILLGDRVTIQNKGIEDSIYTINYEDRNEGEDFSTDPSVAVSKNYTFNGAGLVEEGIQEE